MDIAYNNKTLRASREFLSPKDGPPDPIPAGEKPTNSDDMIGDTPDTLVGLLRKQMQNTTAHAVPRIESAKSIIRKLCWVLIFMAGVSLFLWQSSIIIDKFYDYNTTISIEMKFSKSVTFPAVSICNLNPIKMSTLSRHPELEDVFGYDDTGRKRRKRGAEQEPVQQESNPTASQAQNVQATSPQAQLITRNETPDPTSVAYSTKLSNPTSLSKDTGAPFVTTPGSSKPETESITTTISPEVTTEGDYDNWENRDVDFEAKNDMFQLTENVQTYIASLDYEERKTFGHDIKTMLHDCTWDGYPCSPNNFTQFFNYMYGNCYTFNSGQNGTVSTDKSGPLYGLSLQLYIEEGEYIEDIRQSAGVRVVVHDQGIMPFPEDDGFMAAPGFETSVGLRLLEITRQPDPYSDCKENTPSVDSANIFSSFFGADYTRKACEKSCYNWAIEYYCNCSDIRYKYTNDYPVCQSNNAKTVGCIHDVETRYETDQLDPACPLQCTQPCDEKLFEATVSNVMWPNPKYEPILLHELMRTSYEVKKGVQENGNFISENMVKIDIYYNELNYEYIEEQVAYTESDVVSDLGGQVGLWLGVSIMTCCEFIEFVCDVCMLLGMKLLCSSKRQRASTPIVPFRNNRLDSARKSGKSRDLELNGIDFYN
ncbi:epithelial sodium channel subunit beta-2-like [Glandiceps talaboti]